MGPDEIKQIIEEGIPCFHVDVNGDGTHFEATVVSEKFIGKSTLQQHQMVYASLGNLVGKEIHALSINTYTPDEWNRHKEIRIFP